MPAAIGFVLAFYLSILTGIQGYTFFLMMWPPYVFTDSSTITPFVKRGGNLETDYTFYRHRLCRVDLDRFAERLSDNTVYIRDRVPGGATGLGLHTVKTVLLIPKDAPLGLASLNTNVFSACAEGVHTDSSMKTYFTVIE
jgi:hypothetical protein